jgi:hypothetical protein
MSLKRKYAIVDAPSILGLRPTGVELLPKTLREAGLVVQEIQLQITYKAILICKFDCIHNLF